MLTNGDRVARKPLFISMFCVFVTSPHQWDVFCFVLRNIAIRARQGEGKSLSRDPGFGGGCNVLKSTWLEVVFNNIEYELLIYIRICF